MVTNNLSPYVNDMFLSSFSGKHRDIVGNEYVGTSHLKVLDVKRVPWLKDN